MMRKSQASSMQKTYDECYLICSTAIYFEGQNNEPEALRAWRNALDQIYYHNAYKMPSSWAPRSETEKALWDSLRAMELQCKERVDLLEALRKSRLEAEEEAKANGGGPSKSRESLASIQQPTPDSRNSSTSWLGSDTVPQATYADIPRPQPVTHMRPTPPPRPSYASKKSSGDVPRTRSLQNNNSSTSLVPPPTGESGRTRTPSPEKKAGGMLKTLRKDKPGVPAGGKIVNTTLRTRPPPAAAKAATQVWAGPQQRPYLPSNGSSNTASGSTQQNSTWDPYTRSLVDRQQLTPQPDTRRRSEIVQPPSPSEYMQPRNSMSSFEDSRPKGYPPPYPDYPVMNPYAQQAFNHSDDSVETARPPPPASAPPPPPPPHLSTPSPKPAERPAPAPQSLSSLGPTSISYMKEYPNHPPSRFKKPPPPIPSKPSERTSDSDGPSRASPKTVQAKASPAIPRKAVTRAVGVASATVERQKLDNTQSQLKDRVQGDPLASRSDYLSSSPDQVPRKPTSKRKIEGKPVPARAMTPPTTDDSPDSDYVDSPSEQQQWEQRVKQIMKKLPKGVDEAAAKQIFNEIVIQGDEVHWDDVAGLEIAKSALKETVVYPFLRPDLFMGLREPARGMLLFGPPGTGKTMLARAVATESKSIFFAISASSLTSKFLGESEKLVRALFALAKELAPSIIFVDEIDSLLGARGGGSEHEATRRIKTEFLIQWSDLQKAAAGKDTGEGDATRVLVLAATNLPWAIDEAARRRFVRRQYIPLPEDFVREQQLRTLLSAQKHSLKDRDLKTLVKLTDGFSGSDITALAKDAAMGPLRSLGERLLHMSPEDIRPIGIQDFQASLVNIRPSVSKAGLKEFEDWAREFGERGG